MATIMMIAQNNVGKPIILYVWDSGIFRGLLWTDIQTHMFALFASDFHFHWIKVLAYRIYPRRAGMDVTHEHLQFVINFELRTYIGPNFDTVHGFYS